ncbi:unnamed protein product [Mucor hiemalis]
MMNANVTRFILVSVVLLTGVYLFSTTWLNKHSSNPLSPQLRYILDNDYFAYSTSPWRYNNPMNLTFPHDRFKAAFVTFVKNDSASLTKLQFTMRNLEDQFNKYHHYPYIIFSDQELSEEYMELASSVAGNLTTVRFEHVQGNLYGYTDNVDMKKAEQARIDLKDTMFGDSEDYRFQSRFMAGTIFRHPIMQDLNYSWRFEAGTEYICPMTEDPFQYMFENKKTTSFSMALYEYKETIPTLYDTVNEYASKHRHWIQPSGDPNTLWHFIWDDSNNFNACHFWNNFQISDVSFYRGEKYQSFFTYLDNSNGIFYERWGDPIIQTMGAVMFLTKDDIHFWDTIGYRVANYFTHCPSEKSLYSHCTCRPEQNFDNDGYSCLRFY